MFMPYMSHVTYSASVDRLESLLEQRRRDGADRAAIDARIWSLFGEEYAILFTDLAGFSRRVAEFGIVHFLQAIYDSLRLLAPVIEAHDGILLKVEADSLLVIFRDPRRALDCALAMRRAVREHDAARPEADRLMLCEGLGYGRVLRIGDHDVFGAEVNAASKLGEDTAGAYEILATGGLRTAVDPAPGVAFEPIAAAPPSAAAAFRVVAP